VASTAAAALQFSLLVLSNSSMIVLVVVFGDVLCNYAFPFALSLSLWGSVLFYLIFTWQNRSLNIFSHGQAKARGVLHWSSCLNGAFWSCNYVFLLVANPFVSGLYQTVINESTLVVVFTISYLLLGNRYRTQQWMAFGLLLLGSAIPLFNAQGAGGNSWGWLVLYGLGSWAIGFANVVTESVMRNASLDIDPAQYLCLTNLYSIPIVLGLSWVPRLAQGTIWSAYFLNGMGCLWAGDCPSDDIVCPKSQGYGPGIGIIAMWTAATLSFVCAFIAAHIQRRRDVVYVTVAYTIAPVFSVLMFLCHFVMQRFYTEPTVVEVLTNVVTLGAGIWYKVATLYGGQLEPAGTWLTRKIRIAPVEPLLGQQDEVAA